MALITSPNVNSIAGNSGTLTGKVSYAEGSNVTITPATDKMTLAVSAASGTTLIRSNTLTSTLTWGASPQNNDYKTIFDVQHPLGAGVGYIFEFFIYLTGVPSATPDFVFKVDLKDSSNVNKHKNSNIGIYCLQGANGNGIAQVDKFDGTDFTKLETYSGDNVVVGYGGFEINSGTDVFFKLSGKQSVATSTTTLSAYNATINIYRVE